MRRGPWLSAAPATAMVAAAVALAGCGGADEAGESEPSPEGPVRAERPPAAPASPAKPSRDPGAAEAGAEASPEAAAVGDAAVGELPDGDEAKVEAVVRSYVDALNEGDGAAACAAFAPGGLTRSELPVRRGGCAASLDASIGFRRGGGSPAWEGTEIATVDSVALSDERARVTATVNHSFSDRKYSSIEEDVVYLGRLGAGWRILKPSATLYRAVGYPEPPLKAFTPPR